MTANGLLIILKHFTSSSPDSEITLRMTLEGPNDTSPFVPIAPPTISFGENISPLHFWPNSNNVTSSSGYWSPPALDTGAPMTTKVPIEGRACDDDPSRNKKRPRTNRRRQFCPSSCRRRNGAIRL
uniref:Uncharacterized protein n=1 Tax=Romanomermis culicivorax TaxID=13658 RepID=A0A915KUL0_ROMCU